MGEIKTPGTIFSKSLYLLSPHDIGWQEEKLPNLSADSVIIKTKYSAISMGAEKAFLRLQNLQFPFMTGYESVGEIIQCGRNIHNVKAGDRVVAFYGHRTHAVVDADKIIIIPDNITDKEALLVILGCDSIKGIRKLSVQSNQTILIAGLGAVGLLTLFNLISFYDVKIDVIETVLSRREIAKRIGARNIYVEPRDVDLTAYDLAFECSARDEAFAVLQKALKYEGKLCVLSDGNYSQLQLTKDFYDKELSIINSSNGINYQAYAHDFWSAIRRLSLTDIIDVEINASEAASYFKKMQNNKVSNLKTVITY